MREVQEYRRFKLLIFWLWRILAFRLPSILPNQSAFDKISSKCLLKIVPWQWTWGKLGWKYYLSSWQTGRIALWSCTYIKNDSCEVGVALRYSLGHFMPYCGMVWKTDTWLHFGLGNICKREIVTGKMLLDWCAHTV